MEDKRSPSPRWLYLCAVALGAYLFFKYLFFYCLPFLLALCLCLPVRAIADKICRIIKLRRAIVCAMITVLLFACVFLILYWILRVAAIQLWSLGASLTESPHGLSDIFQRARSSLESLLSRIGLDGLAGALLSSDIVGGWFSELLQSTLLSVCSAAYELLFSLASEIPSLILGTGVCILSCFYFSVDGDKIRSALLTLLPPSVQARSRAVVFRLAKALKGIFISYALLCGATFLVLLVGLSIIGCDYSLLWAALISAVDMLPVLGTGTVLLPWSIICFLLGRSGFGWGLLVIYAVSLVTHQLLEPRILGKSLGIHPLLALASTYIGFKACGFFGLVAAPVAVFLVCNALPHREKN